MRSTTKTELENTVGGKLAKNRYVAALITQRKALSWKHLSAEQLKDLNELLKPSVEGEKDSLRLLSRREHHPDLESLVKFITPVSLNNLPSKFTEAIKETSVNQLKKALSDEYLMAAIDKPDISSALFLEIIDNRTDTAKKLNFLMSYITIKVMLRDNILTIPRLLTLDENQFTSLHSSRMRNYLVPASITDKPMLDDTPIMTIDEVLALSDKQRNLLITDAAYEALTERRIKAADIVAGTAIPVVAPPVRPPVLKPAPDRSIELSEEAKLMVARLDHYLQRIKRDKAEDQINFKHGFILFFRDSRAANRRANYFLAKALRDQLLNNEAVMDVFAADNISANRGATQPYTDRGINSKELNSIINQGKTIGKTEIRRIAP